MKLLFTSPDIRSIGLVRSVLDDAGIDYEVQNETNPLPGFYPEIRVADDVDFARACELRDGALKSAPVAGSAWTCPSCGERLEGQFTECWKCGASRTADA